MTLFPSGPIQRPTLNGIPSGVFSGESGPPTCGAGCQLADNFCVENPLIPACARMLGREAGNPKQSGSMYSALDLPNSRWNHLLPYRISRRIASALGALTSSSSIDDPAGYQRPLSTYCFTFLKSSG